MRGIMHPGMAFRPVPLFRPVTCIRCFHRDASTWPKSANPSHYEIFGLDRHKFDKRELKTAYVRLAKIYHPDSLGMNGIEKLARGVRVERFKKIVAAYNILRDDQKRRAYDFTLERSSRPYSNHPYCQQHYPHPEQSMAYDVYEDEEWFRRNQYRSAEFEQKLRENRNKMTVLVAVATFLVAVVQIKAINTVSDRQIVEQREYTFRTRLDELNARTNYGMGSMQDQRVARFLTTRQTGGYYNPYESDSPATQEVIAAASEQERSASR